MLAHYSSVEDLKISAVEGENDLLEEKHFFEGAEKLLEIWFSVDCDASTHSLRRIPRFEWDALLDIAQCRIIKQRSNECIDSYVLSESSMFVSDSRFILKTCGTTNLLATVDRLLELAQRYCDREHIVSAHYSRKNFLRPEQQPGVHRSFDQEVAYLDRFFHEGAAYCMGSLKKDRWYLYTIQAPEIPESKSHHTLEILMTDMPEERLAIYSMAKCTDARECTKKSGIERILPPGTVVDDELFAPCGYSMNGLLANSDEYVTIHVTPERDFSYVSFETNQNASCLYEQTLDVIECFKPRKILVTLFANDFSIRGKEAQQMFWTRELPGFCRANLQFLRLQNETLIYAQYIEKRGQFIAHSNNEHCESE